MAEYVLQDKDKAAFINKMNKILSQLQPGLGVDNTSFVDVPENKDDGAFAVRQNETRLTEAVLSRIRHVLLSSQHLHLVLLWQRIVYGTLLLADGNIGVLSKAHDGGLWVLHRCLYHGMSRPACLPRPIATTYQKFRVGFQQLLRIPPMGEFPPIPIGVSSAIRNCRME